MARQPTTDRGTRWAVTLPPTLFLLVFVRSRRR